MEKTLKEHLAAAARARWAKMNAVERAAYSAMMNKKRWPNGAAKKGKKNPERESTSAPRIILDEAGDI